MKRKIKFLVLCLSPGLSPLLTQKWGRVLVYLTLYILGAIVHASLPASYWSREVLFFSLQIYAILYVLNWRDLFWRSFRKTKEVVFNFWPLAIYYYLFIVIGIFFTMTGPRISYVDDESMYPTLNRGDHVAYWQDSHLKFKRGDVALFVNAETDDHLFRRILALPRERVTVQSGIIYIDSIPLEHGDMPLPVYQLPETPFLEVPEGKVLWFSENNEDSAKGGTWGFANISDIEGRALWIQKSENQQRNGTRL